MRLVATSVMTTAACLLALFAHAQRPDAAAANSHVFWIGLANGTEAEANTAAELRTLMRKHDLEPWILTRRVLIDAKQIPHSDPILTIDTVPADKEPELLSTFLHEELHWLENEPWRADFRAAMKDYETLFADVPPPNEGGARDAESTYRHLLVCDMEFQVMKTLLGEAVARRTLGAITHYEWVYDKVLNDPRVHEIALRHGFDVSKGVPRP